MLLVTALESARDASLEGNELCLEFAPNARHLRDTLSKSDNVKILREVRARGLAGEQIFGWQTFAVGRGFHGLDLPGGNGWPNLLTTS